MMNKINQKYKSTKITLRVERDGKYVEQSLTPSMVCALFDMQFMINEDWETIKLNKIDRDINRFFKIISYIDDAVHGSKIYFYNPRTKRWTTGERSDHHYEKGSLGKPIWKKL